MTCTWLRWAAARSQTLLSTHRAWQGAIGANEAACLRAACRTLARKAAAQAMLRAGDATTPQTTEILAEVTTTVQECGQLVEMLWGRGAGFTLPQVPSPPRLYVMRRPPLPPSAATRSSQPPLPPGHSR